MDQKRIGAFIARCRKEKNLTQMQLAELLGLPIRQFPNGKMEEECQRCHFYSLCVRFWVLV